MRFKLFFVACFMALAGLATTASADPGYTPKQREVEHDLKKVTTRINNLDDERQKRLNNNPFIVSKRYLYVVHELHKAYVKADKMRYYFGLEEYQTKYRSPHERVKFENKRIEDIQNAIEKLRDEGKLSTKLLNEKNKRIAEANERKEKVFDRVATHRDRMIKHYAKQLGIKSKMK